MTRRKWAAIEQGLEGGGGRQLPVVALSFVQLPRPCCHAGAWLGSRRLWSSTLQHGPSTPPTHCPASLLTSAH